MVHKLSSQVVHKLSGQAAHELSGHPAVNPKSAGSHGLWLLCTRLGSASSSLNVCAVVCGAVHLASSSSSHPYFSSFHCFIIVTGAGMGAHGWVVGICQPWGQFSIWPQWKLLGIPGTHLLLKRGSWLKIYFRKKAGLLELTA